MTIKRFEDIVSWQLAVELEQELDKIVIPQLRVMNEWDLINQLSRSVRSISDNIAEGFERGGNKEFVHFLSVAKGSAGEARSQLMRVSRKLPSNEISSIITKCENISGKIFHLMRYLNSTAYKGHKFGEH